MRVPIIVSMLLTISMLTSCNLKSASDTSSNPQVVPLEPEKIFQNTCSGCHGGNLQGNIGPNLQKIGSKYSQQEIIKIIQSGKGKMPAQSQLSEEAKKSLAQWLSQKK